MLLTLVLMLTSSTNKAKSWYFSFIPEDKLFIHSSIVFFLVEKESPSTLLRLKFLKIIQRILKLFIGQFIKSFYFIV